MKEVIQTWDDDYSLFKELIARDPKDRVTKEIILDDFLNAYMEGLTPGKMAVSFVDAHENRIQFPVRLILDSDFSVRPTRQITRLSDGKVFPPQKQT